MRQKASKPDPSPKFSWDPSATRQALQIFFFSATFAILFNAFYVNGIPLKYAPPQLPYIQDILKNGQQTSYPGWKKNHGPKGTKTTVPAVTGVVPRLSLIGVKDRFDKQTAVILDAREPAAYEKGHIPGALNFSALELDKFALKVMPLLPNKEQEIIAYCNGGDCTLSLELAKTLTDQGYKHVEVFEDGWPTWEKAGYPVHTGETP